MARLNHHYTKLFGGYLFSEIGRKTAHFREKNPAAQIINLGIGDISRPLAPSISAALETAAKEMGHAQTFKGYGPSQGYLFLREAVAKGDYANLGISPDEIFISDGTKSDIGNIQEIFSIENRIAVPDPTYPVYVDTNVMAGRTRLPLKTGGYGGIVYLDCHRDNHFIPELPNRSCDLIYLCSPNNPTGVAMNRTALKKWVDYARENHAIILFDGAYEAYVRSPDCPKSIYEIEGAKEVAIEFRSFSKTAGFTGLRCSYVVVPQALKITESFQTFSLNELWKRRQDTKYNGVPYPVQCAAAAVYSEQGQQEVQERINSYLAQAKALKSALQEMKYQVFGGTDAPYLWLQAPRNMTSWQFFDRLLDKAHIIAIPGIGFGNQGEGYVRLSTFGDEQSIHEAIKRFKLV